MKSASRILKIVGFAVIALMAVYAEPCKSADEGKQVVKVTAKKFAYSPDVIKLKKGVPAVLEFTSLDKTHGFNCPKLGIRSDIVPGKVNRLEFTPQKTGEFLFHCDVFCGFDHDKMNGKIVIEE